MKKLLLVLTLVAFAGLAHADVMTFDTGSADDFSSSYTEAGMTVKSLYDPNDFPHLHLTGYDLYNHYDCCSTPYEFSNGGTFNLVGFNLYSTYEFGSTGTITGYDGATPVYTYSYSGDGNFGFVMLNWTGLTSVVWDETGSYTSMDNFTYNTSEVPEPTTLALLGSGLAGWGFRRFRKVA